MSTNIIIGTMTSRRRSRRMWSLVSGHLLHAIDSPSHPSCHALPAPPPHLLLPSVCLWRQGFSKFDFFLLLLLSMRWCWLPHGDIWNLSAFKQATRQAQGGGVQEGSGGKATITQYIVIYPVDIRQSLRLHLQPFLCCFLSCLLFFISFILFFGKRSWNVLACILVHMCSPRTPAPFTLPWLFWENYKFPLSEKSQLQIIMFASFTTLIRCCVCCALAGPPGKRPKDPGCPDGPVLAKGLDIKIWWHVVISAPCRCLSSPSVRHSPSPFRLASPSTQFDSIPFDTCCCSSSFFPPSSDQCKRLMHSCNFLWPITCCKLG